jgi:hypothetical protein
MVGKKLFDSKFYDADPTIAEILVGRDIRELRLWNDHAKAAEFTRSLLATNEVRNIEDLVRTRSGALVPCLMSGA